MTKRSKHYLSLDRNKTLLIIVIIIAIIIIFILFTNANGKNNNENIATNKDYNKAERENEIILSNNDNNCQATSAIPNFDKEIKQYLSDKNNSTLITLIGFLQLDFKVEEKKRKTNKFDNNFFLPIRINSVEFYQDNDDNKLYNLKLTQTNCFYINIQLKSKKMSNNSTRFEAVNIQIRLKDYSSSSSSSSSDSNNQRLLECHIDYPDGIVIKDIERYHYKCAEFKSYRCLSSMEGYSDSKMKLHKTLLMLNLYSIEFEFSITGQREKIKNSSSNSFVTEAVNC